MIILVSLSYDKKFEIMKILNQFRKNSTIAHSILRIYLYTNKSMRKFIAMLFVQHSCECEPYEDITFLSLSFRSLGAVRIYANVPLSRSLAHSRSVGFIQSSFEGYVCSSVRKFDDVGSHTNLNEKKNELIAIEIFIYFVKQVAF